MSFTEFNYFSWIAYIKYTLLEAIRSVLFIALVQNWKDDLLFSTTNTFHPSVIMENIIIYPYASDRGACDTLRTEMW